MSDFEAGSATFVGANGQPIPVTEFRPTGVEPYERLSRALGSPMVESAAVYDDVLDHLPLRVHSGKIVTDGEAEGRVPKTRR